MSKNRKWKEGEVWYVEGNTTINKFLQSFSSRLVSHDWLPYAKQDGKYIWNFDIRREIWLADSFREENVRLFKAVLQEDGTYEKGDLLVRDTDYRVIRGMIRGIGERATGTDIADPVFIEVNYETQEFQRDTFLKTIMPSGNEEIMLNLKSRPRGRVELYKDTLTRIEEEELRQNGGEEVYLFSRYPISKSKDDTNRVVITVDGQEIDEDLYKIDYFNGVLIFNTTLEQGAVVKSSYTYCQGERKEKIDEEDYKVIDDKIIDQKGTLENVDVIVEVDYYWELAYPSRVDEIEDRVILKTTVDISTPLDWTETKDYYWELAYYDKEEEEKKYKTGIRTRFGTALDSEDETTLDDNLSNEWVKWSWYQEKCFADGVVFDEWLPIKYWLNFTKESLNMVIQGDPTPDTFPYDNYLIAYAYLGKLESYKGAKEDLENNFAFTVSSDQHPMPEEEYDDKWGKNTGTAISDIIMNRTNSNIPFQAHYPSFYTTPEFMQKHFIHTSEYTDSHHFSEITVTHSFERERGKLQDVLIGDRSSIFHLDELISDKDNFDFRGALKGLGNEFKDKCGFPVESKEKQWVMFNINAPYWFANNSPNVHYGIAIRKS